MFIGLNTIERKQNGDLRDSQLNSGIAVWDRPLCAWCLSEQGIEAGKGSHGICTQHADQLLKQWRERHHRRQQQSIA
jgi:hypothetical protein